MNFVDWYKKRGARFILKRAQKLRERYSFNPGKSIVRIRDCVDKLSTYSCYPTFFVPGIVVKRNPEFIHELQDQGCEIGVHGYQHIDMRSIPPQEANQQLKKAQKIFREDGLESYGFRCPYLSVSDDLIKNLEPGLFNYSSNRAIAWVDPGSKDHQKNLLFETIGGFYRPSLAQSTLSLPYKEATIIEIPVSVPDDLQMRDGLEYTLEEISASMVETFNQVHQRGELYNLMFHPELASLLIEPFMEVLNKAHTYQGNMWVTRLRDISEWWKEKDEYNIHIDRVNDNYHLVINSPQRATLLQRALDPDGSSEVWDENYQRLKKQKINLEANQLPLIGISPGLPLWVQTSLDRMGYISVNLVDWEDCTIKITAEIINQWDNPVKLIAGIEDLDVPLVRFWPWPDGYRSALCLSGDLDALSLMDYATRLLPV
jgi:peptidoglycan/xylan/chitin deacetylase (PgdA/CDA1 family)